MRPAGQRAKVGWVLRRWRVMQEFRGIPFYDSINVVPAKLTLIDQKAVRWRFAFEERDCSFDSPNPADERADQQRDDAEMRDEEGKMMFAPRPARQRGTGKVRPEQNQPDVEPWRPVHVGARNFCVETRFINRSGDRGDDEHCEQNDCEFERRKEFKDRIALPCRLLSRVGVYHLWD